MKTNRSYRLLGVACLSALAACSSLLDVKNPNNVNQTDLSNPASAASQASGVLATVARAWGQIITPYSVATDELTWIGSRDAWQSLDQGTISEPTNEFVDAAFFYVGEARWWSDETIKRLKGFDAANVLPDRNDLARTYLSGAMIYTIIGNLFDNFPIGSDRTTAAAPLGAAKMDSVYKVAIAYATSGIAIAQATGDKDLELTLTAERAVARYYLALWAKLNPAPASVPVASPLVNDAAAVADASAALALAGTADWRYQFHYDPTTISTDIGFEVNERLEMRIGSTYVYPICTVSGCASGGKTVAVDSLRLKDPLDNKGDPELARFLLNKTEGFLKKTRYGSLTFLSARELHLIVAEAALAGGDNAGFQNAINAERALDSLTAYTGAGPTALAMLHYERQRNLFMQGKRLFDEYRFGTNADLWQAGSEAITKPGTFLPITISERLANSFCLADPASCGGH
ncbi:MAG: hypothetical protein DMD38_08070 [Gemmatimonadetes bacterium]|nr:MAG: hypothetical protein AUI86_02770 [Gemmatimonadetes bacterium 13_1_40CM_3_66_12]OLD87303.1 MAG: hypothetical protein AUG85_07645 [Gemmatimonadetes bacterium 13_1_20CM_4_66_11]PYP96556.1 MAG: hypothetical protein DMD38_08070 [Gemmatimonadota bacterium]